MKKFLKGLGFFLVIVFSLLYVSKYNYLLKGVSTIYLTGHSTAYLTDYLNLPMTVFWHHLSPKHGHCTSNTINFQQVNP